MKGLVQFFGGTGKSKKSSQRVAENKAVRFDVSSGQVKTIPIRKTGFIREMPSVYQLAVERMRPAAYWRFKENNGIRFGNSVENNTPCEGQYVGDVTFEPGPAFVDGREGKAVKLDGRGGFVLIPDMEPISRECRDYSYAVWVRPDRVGEGSDTAERYCIFAGFGLYGHLSLTKDGYFEYYSLSLSGQTTPENFHRGSQKIQPGRWYHIAVTAKSFGMRKFYVNGVECGPAETVGKLSQFCREISLGSVRQPDGDYNPTLYGKPFNWAISEPALFSRELSPDEVKRLSHMVNRDQVLR
jgi:hypothetical protein